MSIKSKIRQTAIILNGLLRRDKRSRVIFYHDVTAETEYTYMATPLKRFIKHINTIKKLGFSIVPEITQPYNQIQICFDDGFKGIWDCKKYFIDNGLRPTVFIADSLIGKDEYLTIEQIKSLYGEGFLFEGHTRSHTNLTNFTEPDLESELTESLCNLRKLTGIHIQDLCFPQGFYSDNVVKVARECGYRKLYISDPAPYSSLGNEIIPRYLLQDATNSVVRATLKGGQDFLYNHYVRYHKK